MLKLEVIGNLVRDPEVQTLNDGRNVCRFSVASNRRQNGSEYTDYVEVSAWGALGDNCFKYLRKGKKVWVEGTPSSHAWNRQDGSIASKLQVMAREVEFLSPSGGSAAGNDDYQEYTGEVPEGM